MAYSIDVVKQGLYKIPVKVKMATANYTFLQKTLFGEPSVSSRDDSIVMDYATRGISISSEAFKGQDPNRVNFGTPFNEKHIFGLYYNDEDQISINQCDNRVSMDEPLDAPWNMEQRMAYLLAEKRDRIIANHVHSLEKVCSDAIINGSFTAKNEGSQAFPITNGMLSVSGANFTTKPVETLLAGVKLIAKKTGAMPTRLILNPDDATKLLQASAWQNLLDNKRILGNENYFQKLNEQGASYCGSINLPGAGTVEIISYFGGYDNSGTYTYFVPSGKAILCPATVGCIGYCGVYVDAGVYTGKEAVEHGVHIWDETTHLPGSAHVQVQSAPCPIITAIDRYCVFTSVA